LRRAWKTAWGRRVGEKPLCMMVEVPATVLTVGRLLLCWRACGDGGAFGVRKSFLRYFRGVLDGTSWPWEEEEKTSEKLLVSGSNEELVFFGNNEKLFSLEIMRTWWSNLNLWSPARLWRR